MTRAIASTLFFVAAVVAALVATINRAEARPGDAARKCSVVPAFKPAKVEITPDRVADCMRRPASPSPSSHRG